MQITWGPWAGLLLVVALDLEANAIISSQNSMFFEGVGVTVLYLADWVASQLVAMDEPHVPMDPPSFMLSPISMIDAKYQIWSCGIAYTNCLLLDKDYDAFSKSRLMLSFGVVV